MAKVLTPEIMPEGFESTEVEEVAKATTTPQKFIIKDINGESIEIPSVLPWGKEKKVIGIVGQAFEKVSPQPDENKPKPIFPRDDFVDFVQGQLKATSENGDLTEEDSIFLKRIGAYASMFAKQIEESPFGRIDFAKLFKFFSTEAPEIITDLVSIVTGKSATVIDENFEGTSVMAFAIPYVLHSMTKYAGSFTMSAGAGE